MKLLLATNNLGKIREYQALLAGVDLEIVTPRQEGLALEVEESEDTLEGNARLKAQAFARASGLLSLADDSGLEVDALGGEPGVHTARYAGPHATDTERVAYLLRRLEGVPWERRGATFRCVIALARPGGDVLLARGEVRGIIAFDTQGEGGFGYDPVFYLPEKGKRLSQLTIEEKNVVSHRGRAGQAARGLLKELLGDRRLGGEAVEGGREER